MTVHFPDTTLQRYTRVTSNTGVYGESVTSYEYTDDITCDFQNETNSEIAETYGVELTDLYKIYVDLNTTIEDTDVLSGEDGTMYDIIGGIKVYKKFHKYKAIQLRRRRTPI